MASTTQKARDFLAEPMADKAVDAVAGVGPATRTRMEEAGFRFAYNLVGQFLILNKDEEKFKEWLDDEFDMQERWVTQCAQNISDYVGRNV